jgi:Na+/proline symporter
MMLGVFLLGLLTKRVQQKAAIVAMLGGLALMLFVLPDRHRFHL